MKYFDNKRGAAKGSPLLGILLAIMVVTLAGVVIWIAHSQGAFSSGGDSGNTLTGPVSLASCPDDGDSSLVFEVFNKLNTTGAEGFDVTAYIYQQEGNSWVKKASITDTTSPSATSVDCGFRYKVCAVASNSDGGDNSAFKGVRNGDATIDGGCAVFEADRSNEAIAVDAEQHDVLTFQVYDKVDQRFAFDTGDAEAATYEADGTTFTDGDNATAFALASGGFLQFDVKLKGADEDEDFSDQYTLVLIEAPIAEYKEPVVTFEGQTLTDLTDQPGALTSYEATQFDSYEYIYKISGDIRNVPKTLGVYIEAVSGANPSTDLQVDFASAGNYLSTDGVTVKTGAADDTASNAVVYTVQDVTIDVS